MSDTTPRASVPLLSAAQAQKHVTHNEALVELDALICCRLLDRDLTAPPTSPADGDAYLVKAMATGTWAGQDGRIAYAVDGGWRFYAPFVGLAAFVADEGVMLVYTASGWADWVSVLNLQNVPQLGVGTTADATNRLAVKSAALLFDNAGSGVQAKLNKHAAGDTGSLLFQTNYSGRAEFGLTGDDDFHVKVSADGSAWKDALTLSGASGAVALAQGQLGFPATANPSADANTLDDYGEGTWNPAFTTSAGSPVVTMSLARGRWTKIGRMVAVTAELQLGSFTGTPDGRMYVAGLPFVAGSDCVGAVAIAVNSFDTSLVAIEADLTPGGTVIGLYGYASGSIADIGHLLKTNQYLELTAVYSV